MTEPVYWNNETQTWEPLGGLAGIVHYSCCEEDWSLCDEDLTGEETHDALNEGEELCLTCRKRDNVDAPCRSPLCPLRPRFERFLYLWRAQQRRQAVVQLLSWRKP